MFVSKVETGLRLAMPTIVCAARWKTVSISYSPSTRSTTAPVADVAADDRSRDSRSPLRTSSDCGTQSRTRQTTSAPASTRRRTSQPPTSPVAPVTSVGRSRQNDVLTTSVHGASPASQSSLEQALVAQGVHALPEALVPIAPTAAVPPPALERVGLEAGVVAVEVVEQGRLEDEEAAVDPALADLRLLGELGDQIAVEHQAAEPRRRTDGGHRRELPVGAMEGEQRAEVDVGDAVAVGQP